MVIEVSQNNGINLTNPLSRALRQASDRFGKGYASLWVASGEKMSIRYTILIFLVLPLITFSQPIQSVGLKAGGAFATLSWEYDSSVGKLDTDRRWGKSAGAFVEWSVRPGWSLLSEVHFVEKGMRLTQFYTTEYGTVEDVTVSVRLSYISFPMLAKIHVPSSKNSIFILFGPRFDVLASRNGGDWSSHVNKFKDVDLGLVLGLGAEIRTLGNGTVGFEFRYSPSFVDLSDYPSVKVINSSLETNLVLGFDLFR